MLLGGVGLLSAMSIIGCSQMDAGMKGEEDIADVSTAEMALQNGQIGTVTVDAIQGGVRQSQELTYQVINGNRMHQGDIMLGKDTSATPGASDSCLMSTLGNAWTNGTVYYTFGSGITAANQTSILAALRAWENVSAVRFVARTNQADYIEFFNGSGCWSYVGRQGGMQQISLQDNASGTCMGQGSIMHEVGHALGLWHEQSRQDRDSSVIVDLCYVQSGTEHNFNKEVSTAVGPYDANSLMHYASGAFRVSLRTDKPECAGKPATGWPLLRTDGSLITPSSAPTATDITGIAAIYGSRAAAVFFQGNTMRSGGSDWNYGYWKGDCTASEAITGISVETSNNYAHAGLCSDFRISGSAVATLNQPGEQRRAQRIYDWDYGYYKLECGVNEFVSGLSQSPQNPSTFKGIRCSSGAGATSHCVTQDIGAGNHGFDSARADWDWGYYKSECNPGQVVVGVSVSPSTGKAHRLFCCDR
jgi:hypothetical protein